MIISNKFVTPALTFELNSYIFSYILELIGQPDTNC